MGFSGALKLTDLNDYITPSQVCIKPVEQVNADPREEKEQGAAITEIQIDANGVYYELSADNTTSTTRVKSTTGSGQKLEQAQINLNDCLACSGCITSAESVLITLQSHTEVLTFLESNNDPSSPSYKIPVISIAPQTLASLAASVSSSSRAPISPRQILRRVQVFCKEILGFSHVFDTNFARHLALQEHVKEFQERKANDQEGGANAEGQLPMLASACPGWICYAEKAHPEMLPFIAKTKSPQQVMGTLVKNWMGEKWGKLPHEIYHVSVMPCYDKKLEASRQDFYNEVYSTRDVDCVITTGELELMMRERGWNLSTPVPGESSPLSLVEGEFPLPELLSHPGTSSGSYLNSIISHIKSTSPTPLVLSVKAIRNADFEEYVLRREGTDHPIAGAEGEIVFKGAKCYGFRNLQNVVRKVGRDRGVRVGAGAAGKLAGKAAIRRFRKPGGEEKEKERGYDYVEVMACPGGCVNGGGQLKPPATATPAATDRDEEGYKRNWEESGVMGSGGDGGVHNANWGDKEWTRKVEEAYWHDLPTPPASPPPMRLNRGEEECGHNGKSNASSAGMRDAELRTEMQKKQLEYADRLVAHVLRDLCQDDEGLDNVALGKEEISRQRFFRTQYRAVESEVIGLAVKW